MNNVRKTKGAMKTKNEIWSAFKVEKFDVANKQWYEELFFYMGDCTNIYNKNDWRFCEIKDKRKFAIYIGKGIIDFPIKFPITLDIGIVLEK